ncbi:MAG TPA: helix-turn-helix transcriptional regulator [Granulicella sp.]
MAVDICKLVGRRVRAARRAKGWTQQILADHAELTREHINRIEDGSKEMGIRTLQRVAEALGKTAKDLLD